MLDRSFIRVDWPQAETTPLFGIRPLGEGTGDAESLFSYFLRVAHEHRLTPRNLVDAVLRDVIPLVPPLQGWRIGWGWDKDAGRDMLSGGSVTQKWVRVLAAATGQAGLEASTLIALSGHVSGDLLAPGARVCLQCLAEDSAKGTLPYGRLLWRLKAVTCCPAHRSHLVEPACGRGEALVRAQFGRVKLAGVCNQCGSVGHRCFESQSTEATFEEIWRAKQCQRMIGALPQIAASDPRAVPQCIKRHCDRPGALTSLALRSGATLSVLSRWMNNPHARLSFDQLLDICGVEGLELATLLQGRLEASREPGGPVEPARVRRKLAPVDHQAVKAALEDAVRSGESVTQVAERLRVDIATLARHKSLYKQVREATRQKQNAAMQARQDEAVHAAETAALRLARQNRPITHRNARKIGMASYPSETPAAILSMIRIGLGDRTLAYPPLAYRMGEPLLKKIEAAVQRVSAATGGGQERLPLQYR